jgi:hypothetical protein
MNGCDSQIDENTPAEGHIDASTLGRTKFNPRLLSKRCPDMKKTMQLSAEEDFTLNGTREKMKKNDVMTFEYHNQCMQMTTRIQSIYEMIGEIHDAARRASKEHRVRLKKIIILNKKILQF